MHIGASHEIIQKAVDILQGYVVLISLQMKGVSKLIRSKSNIYDIAKEAGVSPATVSRVLNGNKNVAASTRDKILAVIKDRSYVPNMHARNLSIGRAQTIAFLVPDVENPFFSKILHGITDRSQEHDYNIFMFGTNENTAQEHKVLSSLNAEMIKGLIVIPVSEADKVTKAMLGQFEQRGVPVVLIDRDISGKGFDGVFSEDDVGACQAVELFVKEGHRSIGIIAGSSASRPGMERLRGYMRALKANGIDLKPEYIADGSFLMGESYLAMKRLMELETPPTAVLASNNMATLGCLKYMKEKGLRLRKDISLIGFDDIPELEYAGMELTVVERHVYEMGCVAMEILENRFQSKREETASRCIVRRTYVKTWLILRGSEKIGLG